MYEKDGEKYFIVLTRTTTPAPVQAISCRSDRGACQLFGVTDFC